MDSLSRTRADRQKNSPFKSEAATKFGSVATKAIPNSRIPPPYRRVRVPLISPEIFEAKLDQSCFEPEGEDREKMDVKDSKNRATSFIKDPVCVTKPDQENEDSDTSFTSTSSGSDSTSSEDEDCEKGEENSANSSDEALIFQSSSYIVKQMKADMAKEKQVKKLEVKNEPLFNKPLELCEASLQYLDEKCSLKSGKGESKKVIKQSQKEYQRNRAAFRDIRRKDWERRHQRREQRRQAFKQERELEAKEEKQSSEGVEEKRSVAGGEETESTESETETDSSESETESSDEDEESPDLVQSVPLE